MLRRFKSKNIRGQWSVTSMKEAVLSVLQGGLLRTVAKEFGMPRNTLRRKVTAHLAGETITKDLLFGTTTESWIQCQLCSEWTHFECAGASQNQHSFVCERCA